MRDILTLMDMLSPQEALRLSEGIRTDDKSMPTIYITSNGPTGARWGRFPLQHDEQGPFVVLPGGKAGVKVRLDPAQIKVTVHRVDRIFREELPFVTE